MLSASLNKKYSSFLPSADDGRFLSPLIYLLIYIAANGRDNHIFKRLYNIDLAIILRDGRVSISEDSGNKTVRNFVLIRRVAISHLDGSGRCTSGVDKREIAFLFRAICSTGAIGMAREEPALGLAPEEITASALDLADVLVFVVALPSHEVAGVAVEPPGLVPPVPPLKRSFYSFSSC